MSTVFARRFLIVTWVAITAVLMLLSDEPIPIMLAFIFGSLTGWMLVYSGE